MVVLFCYYLLNITNQRCNTSIVISFRILFSERKAENCGAAMPGCIMLGFQLQTPFLLILKLNKNIEVPSYSDFRLVFDIA